MTITKYVIFKERKYKLFLYSQEEWNEYMINCPKKGSKNWWFWMFFPKSAEKRGIEINYPCWIAKRVGAVVYTWGINCGLILMRDNVSFIIKKMLLRHEIGHIFGYGHTWTPTIMNPTRFFRWFLLPKTLWGKIEIVD